MRVGWWHPTVKDGRVHEHPERPNGSWSVPMHRLCQPVYSRSHVIGGVTLDAERVHRQVLDALPELHLHVGTNAMNTIIDATTTALLHPANDAEPPAHFDDTGTPDV